MPLLWRRRRATPDPAEQRERSATLSTELRLLSERLRTVADELAEVHGVKRRSGDNGTP